MSKVHVYPAYEMYQHNLENGHDCICEPQVIDEGFDDAGERALVFLHQEISKIKYVDEPKLRKTQD